MFAEEPLVLEGPYPTFQWWYDLDQPFVAHAELLTQNRRYDTSVEAPDITYDVAALLPRLPDREYRIASYLAPPQGWSATSEDTNEGWGTDYKDPAMGFVGVVVKRLAFVSEIPSDDVVPAHLRAEWGVDLAGLDIRYEMDKWWDNVRTWLEISTGQRLTQVGQQQRAWDPDARTRIWLISDDAEPRHWRGGGTPIDPGLPAVHGVEPDVFAACAALSNIEPPVAWNLLRDARALQGVGQYRRAVIDAATAAELAVGDLLTDRLKDVEEPVRSALLGKNPMLGRKTDLLSKLGRSLPQAFMDDLVNKRNKAVHDGVDPTYEECEAAIQAALVQIETVFPLPASPVSGAPLICRW